MNTAILLMVQYNARAVIPVDLVVRDFFPHLSTDKFVRKVGVGDINIPLIRMEPRSQKGAKGVHLVDLVRYIEEQREAALKEASQLANAFKKID